MNYKIFIIIIAIIIFILSLGIIGYILYNNKTSILGTNWSPLVSNCPDYWMDLKGDGTECLNAKNLGNCPATTTLDMTQFKTNCDKYKFATSNGLTWDGITNMPPSNCS
jgi:hypothetical protein